MISFASQRAGGQDLATHLQNDLDNDYLEVAELRGAIATDLHGAFAEWELQARGLTKCEKYLYSLSINPWDQINGQMTRDQYADYIERVEDRLGLSGQPRAVVFHIKDGREHAHVVWSRIDTMNEKAIQLSFDKEKLMMVTREFAREHGLILPDGYEHEREGRNKQHTLYEQYQQNQTGLSKEERMERITQAWRTSDNAQAFVSALAEQGYVLATGKRPYVLVDANGHTSALPRMIDDKAVRAKDVQAFLAKDFPPDSLPSVDEAKRAAAQYRAQFKQHEKVDLQADRRDRLKAAHEERRKSLGAEREALQRQQDRENRTLAREQVAERNRLFFKFAEQEKQIAERREQHKAKGLAAFLGRVTGVGFAMKKFHERQDTKRLQAYYAKEMALQDRHRDQNLERKRHHDLQKLDIERKMRNLSKIEAREQASLEAAFEKERNLAFHARREYTPTFGLDLSPPGRKAQPHKAANRHRNSAERKKTEREAQAAKRDGPPDLTAAFDRAAGAKDETDGGSRGSGDQNGKGPRPGSGKPRGPRSPDRGRDR